MEKFNFVVHDSEGLHARPASILAKMTAKYPCSIKLSNGEKTVDAKRLFSIMGLAVKCGQEITLSFEGEDEKTAYEEVLKFCEENL